ncbi:unnamed protein product, partial [Prorocentrum cordatum]
RHYNWAHQLNSGGDRSVHEHFCTMKVLELAAEVDQLNIPTLVSLEALGRRAVLIEQAHLNSPGSPDYTGAGDFMGWGPGRGRALVAPTLVKHVAEKARDKASVYKELRKHNEELRLRKPPKGHSRPRGWAFSLVSSLKSVTSRGSFFLYRMFLGGLSLVPTFLGEFGSESRGDASPPDAAKMIVDFDTHLLKNDNQWGAEVERGLEHIGSYMDPRLRFSRRSYLNFIGDLFRGGLLAWRRADQVRGGISVFFVRKKSGKQRLVVDCRRVDARFRECLRAPMGSGSSWADVAMDTDTDMFLSLSDVKDYFYACGLPPGLESFFCLPDITGEELKVVAQGDPTFGYLWGSTAVTPAMKVMPMGWAWSFSFAQVLHAHQVHQIRPWSPGAVMQDRVPPPPFRTGAELALPYCDNFVAAASSLAQADALREDCKRRMTSLGFEVHEEEAARHWAESLGFAIDGLTGERRPSPVKARRLRQVCRRVGRQRPWLSGRQLERLLGHATFQFLGHRPLLSVFRSCCTFVQCHYLLPRRLWRTAAEELRAAAALLPFARANMRRPWASEVEVFDASPAGCGVTTATLPKEVVSEIGKAWPASSFFEARAWGHPRQLAWVMRRLLPPTQAKRSHGEASAGLPQGPAGSRPVKGAAGLTRAAGAASPGVLRPPRRQPGAGPPPTHRRLAGAASARTLPANADRSRKLQILARRARARARRAAVEAGGREMQEELELKGIMVSLLEMKSVGKQSIPYYLQKFREFLDFVVDHGFDLHKDEDVDEALVQLMDLMYLDGWQVDQGEKLLAAVKLGIPRFSRAGLGGLPRAARALRGFRKAAPEACRLGLPRAWVVAIVAAMLWRGRLESARRVVVMHDAYLRTGEATRLRAEDFAPPVGDHRGHERGVLILGSSSAGVPTETGVLDDAVTLSDWDFPTSKIQELLKAQRAPHEPLFVTKPAAFRKDFDQACLDPGLDKRNLASYQLRHSGPSRDALLGRRALPDIMKRGRWATLSSVKRCERRGVMQKALASSPKELLDFAAAVESSIVGALL